ncbi:MAG: LysM peptidoglycan-binding domain-containing protein [Clostridia bacterium]|nr:LysM peptidoglycan-binding domain-containing protein [Clostridia bacterium]
MEENKNVQELNEEQLNEAAGGWGQARWISYTIVRGDTLTKIANRFNVTVSKLVEWNAIDDPDHIVAGHKLRIYTNR